MQQAAAYHQAGQLLEAARLYRVLAQAQPEVPQGWLRYVEVLNDLGIALQSRGQAVEAEAVYRQALEIVPEAAILHSNLGNALKDQGRLAAAEAAYQRAVALAPEFCDALFNLGVMYQEHGRFADAVKQYRHLLSIEADHVDALHNLGIILWRQDALQEAEAMIRRALARRPAAELFCNLGHVLKNQGRLEAAEAAYRRAIALKPAFREAYGHLLFTLNYHPDRRADAIFADYADYDRRFGWPERCRWLPHRHDRRADRRLRVGYVSPAIRQHACMYFLEPLLAHHDRQAFEIVAYAELAQPDEVSTRFRNYVDQWIVTAGMSDEALLERIRADQIDILVDVAGHTAGNRLAVFAGKPAPVSLHWLDFGYTTGLTAIDYYLTDDVSVPPGSEHIFSETPWRLAAPALAYRPAPSMGAVGPLPAQQGRGLTFGTLTRAMRINHRTIRVWSEILRRVEGARLVMDSCNFRDAVLCQRVAAQFAAHGVAVDRLEIGYHTPPWDLLRNIDIALDCFPHNSGTTLVEGLYLGVPFVTLAGRPSVGRLGAALLTAVGYPEWIAESEEEYVEIAVRLASDLPGLAALRSGLRAKMQASPLMDEVGFARRVETAYRAMFRRWADGE